ncbi:MAG: FTR1 family protein [Leptolyngbya sp. UWPOB_LEPTO1]|uniref:FTR1 family iron permease n=1 Tax=Leptolyngbya sp. UWPOB_LEPTO1 TaxID=2815653 RepID=UPI001AC61775|nr:FTR1 family protein [Leptolyngbya sp. UWPOB_LEPTO1]MBN8562534.1 FTR1 family protein [Leptolyngbya sp. UWPOB_LEPTO1]
MLSTFVITLREGVEAALVVGIVLAYLNKANRSYLNPWVYAGIAAGILASVAIGTIFIGTLSSLDTTNQLYLKPLLEAIFGLIAIALLSWMLIWMTRQAKSLKGEVEHELDRAIQTNAAWGIFGIIFFAVLREGFETVVFIAAQFQQGGSPVIGAMGGLCGATIIGILLFKLGIKINLKQFFQVMGIFLLLIVSGLVIGVLAHLNKSLVLNPNFPCTQDSCILGGLIWDTSQVLPQKQFPGVILHTLFGYVDRFYWAEAIAYFTFLATVGTLYLRSLTEPKQAVPLESP